VYPPKRPDDPLGRPPWGGSGNERGADPGESTALLVPPALCSTSFPPVAGGLGGGSAAKASTQTGGGAASSGPSQSVFINVQGKSRFTADEVNDLMEQLIERQRDGDQLVLVR
jgi:hypothetical protein